MRAFIQSVLVCAAVSFAVIAVAIPSPDFSVEAGSQAKNRGAELFATRGCAHCHGTAGVGGAEGPDLQRVRKRMNKAQIARQIHDGGKSMPAYGDTLTPAQIDDLVAYLRAKRKFVAVAPKPAAEPPAPAAATPDPE